MVRPIENDSESLSPDLSDPEVLDAEIERVGKDKKFLDALNHVIERNREILDRLADS